MTDCCAAALSSSSNLRQIGRNGHGRKGSHLQFPAFAVTPKRRAKVATFGPSFSKKWTPCGARKIRVIIAPRGKKGKKGAVQEKKPFFSIFLAGLLLNGSTFVPIFSPPACMRERIQFLEALSTTTAAGQPARRETHFSKRGPFSLRRASLFL